jgi:hypothetical protein
MPKPEYITVGLDLSGFRDALKEAAEGLSTFVVLAEVRQERARQYGLWGEQNHPDVPAESDYRVYSGEHWLIEADFWKNLNSDRGAGGQLAWDGILLEEVFEALSEEDPLKLRAELVQVAAVAVAWIEAIDRRSK